MKYPTVHVYVWEVFQRNDKLIALCETRTNVWDTLLHSVRPFDDGCTL